METAELTRRNELVFILDAKLSQEAREAIFKEVVDLIQKSGGKVINNQVWIERQKLTFPIRKCTEGAYYIINFEGESALNGKLRHHLTLNEKIVRFAIMKSNKRS